MTLANDLLTPLAAVCLIARGYPLSAQEEPCHGLVLEQAADWRASVDLVLVETQVKGQPTDRNTVQAARSAKINRDTAFPKGRLLFAPNSVHLTFRSKKWLELVATWLRQHDGERLLVVGYCDELGSEACTLSLAEHRATMVRQVLLKLGTRADQIVGVKAWKNAEGACSSATYMCQERNRSARIFIAPPAGSVN